jgi:GPI mannosyltransferase 3
VEALSTPEGPPGPELSRSAVGWLADRRLWPVLLLGLALSLGSALRLWLATHDDGIFWPDEIYQSLEPAHRLVFGYGILPWEFQVGARNWAFPGFIALLLKAAALAGLTDPRSYVIVVRAVFCLIGVATAAATFQLASSLGTSALSAAVGASLFALTAPAIFFAPRAMGESASALLVVLGLTLALQPRAGWKLTLGMSLLALAVFLRLQNAIFGLGLVGVLAFGSRKQPALVGLTTFAAGMVVFGVLDAVTWGSFFHSATTYVRTNLVEGRAAGWGTSWIGFYPVTLVRSMGPAGFLMLAFAAMAIRRSFGLWLLAVAFGVAHSLIPHKELRFLLPALPLFCALAGIGLDQVRSLAPVWLFRSLTVLVLASVLLSAATFHRLTFRDLGGPYLEVQPGDSAYDNSGSVNRLLFAANRRPDLCGLEIQSVQLHRTGGYSYLHRPVPLYGPDGPASESGKFNYVIASVGSTAPAQVVAVDGEQALARLPATACRPDPGYAPRL